MAKKRTNKNILDLKPEEVDAIIMSKLSQFPARGAKRAGQTVFWSDEEYELIDGVIWSYITENGFSRERCAQQISSRWDIAMSTARRWIADSVKRMAGKIPEEDIESKRQKFLERCENILTEAIESGDKSSALKAMDIMAKANGFYKETKDINVDGEVTINFDFQ